MKFKKRNLFKIILYFIAMMVLVALDSAGRITNPQFWFGFITLDILFTLVS